MARPVVFGTAGHIDHGKTTLVRALTGTDTDRLPDEKRRGISIDLGFAPWTLPSGRPAAFVDVPGHERFVRNMVAGVHGMDAVLLVVAADEGVMPQTREHLAILTLLGVDQGLAVLTKRDLVDTEWLELVQEETREAVAGTFLADAPMLAVSAVTGDGLDELVRALDRLADGLPPRDVQGSPRLPIDRVFTVRGFGTVVTGTLTSGRVRQDDALVVMPEGWPVRARGLEVHGRRVEEAEAGQRVAVNLGGVERSQLRRGQVLSRPGALSASTVAQVRVSLLENAPALKQRSRVHVHAGTDEVLGRLYFYDRDALAAGAQAWAELRTEAPVVLLRGDRVLFRSYSPVTTIGGGVVAEVGQHHSRREPDLLARLDRLLEADPVTLALDRLAQAGSPRLLADLARESDVEASALANALQQSGQVTIYEGRWAVHRRTAEQVADAVLAAVNAWHAEHPLRRGMPREMLKPFARGWDARHWTHFLTELPDIVVSDDVVARRGFRPSPGVSQRQWADQLRDRLAAEGLRPSPISQLLGELGVPAADAGDFLAWMVDEGRLVRLDDDHYVVREAFEAAAQRVQEALAIKGRMGTSELREVLGTNRKFAVLVLERMDEARITRRMGDERVLAGGRA
jgi:selenocysteine-specific elongation factor